MCDLVAYRDIKIGGYFITYDNASRIPLLGWRTPVEQECPFKCGRCGRGKVNAETVVGDGEEAQIMHLCWDKKVAVIPDLSDENVRYGDRIEL